MTLTALTVAVALTSASAAAQHQHPAGHVGDALGTVKFATSCTEPAQPAFLRGMALLHSFEFGPAIDSFTAAAKTDPGCGIAYWGVAVSRWGNPFAAGIKPPAVTKGGAAAIEQARAAGARTDRERAYIEAAAQLFTNADTIGQRNRVLAYRDAMKKLAAQYADDAEASAFYALALASSQDPTDMTYSEPDRRRERSSRSWRRRSRTIPASSHYVIHAYDAPPLASRGLDAARRYAKVAPSAPHALHMPSHTFTRLGYWQDSIDTNILSAEAARKMNAAGRGAARDGLRDLRLPAAGAGRRREAHGDGAG